MDSPVPGMGRTGEASAGTRPVALVKPGLLGTTRRRLYPEVLNDMVVKGRLERQQEGYS